MEDVTPPLDTPPDLDPVERFRGYILRSVQAARGRIDDHSFAFPAEVRERAINILDFALELPEAWPATRDLLLALAPKMELAGQRDDWLTYLARGVACSEQWDDPLTGADLSLQIGLIQRLRGHFDAARLALEAAAATFAALGVTTGQARALAHLAYVDWQQSRYADAESCARAALAQLSADDEDRALALSALGLAVGGQGRWVEAEAHHHRALAIRQALGDQRRRAWSLQNLGYALRGQRNYSAAVDYLQQAIAGLSAIGDIAYCAIVQMNLGIVYGEAQSPIQALEMYALAEPTFRRLHDQHNLAKLMTSQGLDHLALGHYVQAKGVFTASIALFEDLGDHSWRLNALDGLGMAYLINEEFDQATTVFEMIYADLEQIAGTPMYDYLSTILPGQLAQAKQGGDGDPP